MSGDPNATNRSLPSVARPHRARWAVVGGLIGALGLGARAASLHWPAERPLQLAPPAANPSPPLPRPSAAPGSLATRGEAAILAEAPGATKAYRFELQLEIVVLSFATLAEQASALNRVAALVEKRGFPRDRVLDVGELRGRIQAEGGTPDTFYFGHDYRASDVLRFLAMLGRSGLAPTEGEAALRRMVDDWGWRDGTNEALISLVDADPADPAPGLDAAARATILRHELSHGLYFVSPAYARYARTFWDTTLTEPERARFRQFLAGEGYDTSIEDLVVNETQAYLMHTGETRFFNAQAVEIAGPRLDALRALFLTGMPPGWLRDCTALPKRAPRRRRRAAVRTRRKAADARTPLRAAWSSAVRSSRR